MTNRPLMYVVLGFLFVVRSVDVSSVDADDRLRAYYEGLRERRLFTVAEGDALRRIAEGRITAAQRSGLAMELSKTYAAHASFSVGEERDDLWLRAERIIEQLLAAEPDTRFRVQLLTQRAMVLAARGAQLRWQGDLFPLDASTRQQARAALHDALKRLKPLPDLLHEELRTQLAFMKTNGFDASRPVPAHVHQLDRIVEYTIAAASLDLAKVLSPGADRTAALHDADRDFAELVKIVRPDEIAWRARVHRLDIMRLREQFERVETQVAAFLKKKPPAALRDAAVAVLVRSGLDAGRPDEALAALEEHRQSHNLDNDELRSLVVESLLAARRIAQQKGDESLAADLRSRAESVDAQLSGPWRTRTRLLLEQLTEEDRYGVVLAQHVRQAQWAWQNGNVEEAITAYGHAAMQAHQQGQPDMAVEFALATASVQVEAGKLVDAEHSLSGLLRAYPQQKKADEADLLRAFVLGRLFEQQPDEERKSAYVTALVHHREAFADRPSAAEATWMLARLREYEQDWEAALELLREIPPDSPRGARAIAQMAVVFDRAIEEKRQQQQPTDDWEQRAITTLGEIVAAFPQPPSRLREEQALIAHRLADILLHGSPVDFAKADHLLKRVVDSGRIIEREIEREGGILEIGWQTLLAEASRLRIISLAGQGQIDEARITLEQVTAGQPSRLLDILNGLTDLATSMSIEHRRDIGQMQWELATQIKSSQPALTAADERQLDMALAQANVAIGKWQPAARLYEERLWKTPKDRQVLHALATLYEECGTPSCLRQSIDQWRKLESLQRKGSLAWLESRYHMALCHHRLGEDGAAKKLIGVTRVLYPDLGTPALKSQFEALAAEIK